MLDSRLVTGVEDDTCLGVPKVSCQVIALLSKLDGYYFMHHGQLPKYHYSFNYECGISLAADGISHGKELGK